MIFTVQIAKHNIAFECAEDETVIDAAERAGYLIPYSCRKGLCSSCAGKLVKGDARVKGQGILEGSAEDILLCQAYPLSNIEIAPARIRKVEPVRRRKIAAKVHEIRRPVADVAIIRLRLPIGLRAPFRAGQYLRVILDDGDSRNYSMANPPQKNDEIELHIRHVRGGKFSELVLSRLEKGSVINVEMPFGEFNLTENQNRKAVLIASGTGFAPMKSIIEDLLFVGSKRKVDLYWGVNGEEDLYMALAAQEWAERNSWFSFTPVVSSPSANWNGRSGFVHRVVLDDIADMSAIEVYACGAPIMIEAARADFVGQAGLDPNAFFCDAFLPSGDGS